MIKMKLQCSQKLKLMGYTKLLNLFLQVVFLRTKIILLSLFKVPLQQQMYLDYFGNVCSLASELARLLKFLAYLANCFYCFKKINLQSKFLKTMNNIFYIKLSLSVRNIDDQWCNKFTMTNAK